MSNGMSGAGQGRTAAAVVDEREALHAKARLYLHVAKATMSNGEKRDADSAALLARNLGRVEDILAKLEGLADVGGAPPPKPWWSALWAMFISAIRMAGEGHGHLALGSERGGAR